MPTMPEEVEAAPKKIIICCDGTWQSSVSGKVNIPSNVTRIARTIAKAGRDGDKVWQQLVYYDAGVGTGSLSIFETSRQGATGDGLVTNVLEAYNFVVNNYSPGDKIYCFGFSRGAFTARAVAGMITDFGVIKPDNMKHFASLFAVYQKNIDKYNFRKTKEYFEWYAGKAPFVPESKKEYDSAPIPWYDMGAGDIEYENSRSVELVGVFDTVGSLGYADTRLHGHASSRRQYEWLNVKWNPYIKHAFHALALDDRREPFLPTLYYIPKENAVEKENDALKDDEVDWPELTEHRRRIDEEFKQARTSEPDLVQVWFTGVHINVGGGTDEADEDYEGLANITFAWMVEQCRPYLAFDKYTNPSLANYLQRMVEHALIEKARKEKEEPGMMGKAVSTISDTGKWLGSFFYSTEDATPKEKMVRSYCYTTESPKVLSTSWTLFKARDSYDRKYQVMSAAQPRTPGTCTDRSTEAKNFLKDLGDTHEWIHPSVKWRLDTSKNAEKEKYECKPLDAFKYDTKDGEYGWQHKTKDVWIPEWPITAAIEEADESSYNENAEMAIIERCTDHTKVREFLKTHAEAWLKAHRAVK